MWSIENINQTLNELEFTPCYNKDSRGYATHYIRKENKQGGGFLSLEISDECVYKWNRKIFGSSGRTTYSELYLCAIYKYIKIKVF